MSDDLERNISQEERDASRAWFEKSIKGCSPEKWSKALRVVKARNKIKYDEMSEWINGKVGGERINPEYSARAEATKELRESLKAYAGSLEAASDLLFSIKKEADAEGKDFTQIAREKVTEMKGEVPVEYPYPSIIMDKPKVSLANRLLHKLWKMGFPVHKFMKKEFSVDEANK